MRSAVSSLLALAIACLPAVAATSPAPSRERLAARGPAAPSPVVVPVEGPSNFHRLGLPFESSSMGRTGVWGPRPESSEEPPANFMLPEGRARAVVLTGADLFRFECRPCHKAEGGGAPPEIPTIVGPVQATSATLMERRMKERGRPITPAFARELAAGSEKDLLERLKKGGQKMPSFGYLTDNEIRALLDYLNVLASVPVNGKPATVTEPAGRVGELLVKGTCHICHDATGTWPNPEELMQGSIPPIAGFTAKKTMPELIWKVRRGAPVVMGSLRLQYRGRMPVFDYLSVDEVASAYLHLIHYPPQDIAGPRKE
jgi:mono/diheme cytochrome c family protein